ncbi:MAG: DMT family transporter, partial [Thermoplasmata archaeon]|nr:DMT family transporter [Thermoplasmata archaeon]
LWTSMFGFLILPSERPSWRGALGLGCGFVGVVIIFLPELLAGSSGEGHAELLVLGAALVTAIGAVGLRRLVHSAPQPWGLTTEFAAAAVLLGALSYAPGAGHALPWNEATVGSLAFLVLGPSVIGYTIYFQLLHRTGPTRASLVTYLNPLVGIAAGILLLSETVSLDEIGGFLLIVLGLAIYQRERSVPHSGVSSDPGPVPNPDSDGENVR